MEPPLRAPRLLLLPLAVLVSACGLSATVPRLEPTGAGRSAIVREGVRLGCREATAAEVARIHPSLPPRVHAARCDFDSTVLVHNDTAAPRALSVAARWLEGENVVADLGDGPVPAAAGATSVGPFPVVLAPHESRSLRLRGTVLPRGGPYIDAVVRSVEARHFVVWPHGGPQTYAFTLPARVDEGAVDAPLTLSVRRPASWTLVGPGPVTAVAREGETTVERYQGSTAQRVDGSFEVPGSRFHPGGPLLGLGFAGNTMGAPLRFVTSVGYEVGFSDWVLASVRFDTDFKQRTVIAPVVEVASPYIRGFDAPHSPRIPSVGLGIGAPLWLQDGAAGGVRGQVTLSLPALGIVHYVDWFPALGRTDLVVMVQASL